MKELQFKVLAYEVSENFFKICLFYRRDNKISYTIIWYIGWLKFPPVMWAEKNNLQDDDITYKGFGAEFIHYFADHLQIT